MDMDMKYEKQGRIVAIIETVFTVLLGIVTLIMIILAVVSANTGQNPLGSNTQYQGVLMVAAIVHGILFLVTLGLLILLWNGILNKSYGQCAGWYITHSVFTALNILGFIVSWFTGLPFLVYIIPIILISYRIWSIHVIKSLGDVILINRGKSSGILFNNTL